MGRSSAAHTGIRTGLNTRGAAGRIWMVALALSLGAGIFALPACQESGSDEVEWVTHPPEMAPDTYCIVSGEPAKTKFTVKYKGKLYPLCCKKCVRAFRAEPERYAQEAAEAGGSTAP